MQRKIRYFQTENNSARDRWLISYTDIVTILLILFVAAAAQGMKARVAPAAAAPVTVPGRASLLEAERKLKPQGLDVRMEPRGLVISLPQTVLFPSGEDRLSEQALPTIAQIAAVIRATDNRVVLVGHADTVPIHNRRFTSNWELSAARSLSLLALLTAGYGIPESRLSIQSYGSNSPRGSNETGDGRAANRRVEILILDDAHK